MAIYCMKCGKELVPGARFCPECGSPVDTSEDRIAKRKREKPHGVFTIARRIPKFTLAVCVIGGLGAAAYWAYDSGILNDFWYETVVDGRPVEDYIPSVSSLSKKEREGLNQFTGCWMPVAEQNPSPESYVIGLIYVEEYDAYGYYEQKLKYWYGMGNWDEITDFDYDESTGVLTIPFDRGNAEFYFLNNGNLAMSNYGGTYEFYLMDHN